MVTMFAPVFTDATLPPQVLQPLLAAAADRSFNSITVVAIRLKSGTVLLYATQRASHRPVGRERRRRGPHARSA
jgi:glutamate N-acetyltransferase/amino-acid N-acetyltransferase